MRSYGTSHIRNLILILLISLLSLSVISCGEDNPGSETSDTAAIDTENDSEPGTSDDTVSSTSDVQVISDEPLPDGAIAIGSASELAKIGTDKDHPLDGYYVLTADIDLSSDNSWNPIGGAPNSSGIVRGNVFNGTLDGMGHIISGLTISKENYETSFYGLFGSIGGKQKSKPCKISNIVFRNVDISLSSSAQICAGTLAGQASGYVEIDNITLLSGTISIVVNGGESLGAGGLIGQCRSDTGSDISNNGISVRNVFCNLDIIVTNNRVTNWCSGIIGRVRASDIAELCGIVFVGSTSYNGESGYAVTSGDSGAKVSGSIYYLFGSGMMYKSLGTAVTDAELVSGNIELGDEWTCEEGLYPIPTLAAESSSFNMLDMVAISFSPGENAQSVKTDFTLPTVFVDGKITWESSNTDYLSINGSTAVVKQPESGFAEVTLTANYKDDKKTYDLIIKSSAVYGFESKTASPGDTLNLTGYSADAKLTWTITDMISGAVKTVTGVDSYTLPDDVAESLITVSAVGYDDMTIYCSSLPVVYITSGADYYDIVKAAYTDAEMTVQGTDEITNGLYSGDIKIKLRGNSTASRDKRPFKIKLDYKENICGIADGVSKHWVLLANDIDHTLLRNKLLYDLSGAIGTEVYMHSINVSLVYNGEYYGVYQLCEHIRVSESRVDVFDWMDYASDAAKAITDKLVEDGTVKYSGYEEFCDGIEAQMLADYSWIDSGSVEYKNVTYTFTDYGLDALPETTGGWLLEMDFYSKGNGLLATMPTAYMQPLYFNSPQAEDPVTANSLKSTSLYSNAVKYVQSFEYALHSDDFYYRDSDVHYAPVSDTRNTKYKEVEYSDEQHDGWHYSELFDMDNLVENFIFCEIAMNWDSMKNSFFCYKDIDGTAKIGPQWDFDWAWGNISMYGTNTWYPTKWHTTIEEFTYEQYFQTVQWNRMLIRDPYFLTKAYEKWHEIRPTVIEEYFGEGGILDTSSSALRNAGLANDTRWKYSYRAYNKAEYDESTALMKEFLATRIAWLDKQFESVETLAKSLNYYAKSEMLEITDVNVGDSKTTVRVSVTDDDIKSVTFQFNGVIIADAVVSGGKAEISVSNKKLPKGELSCVEVKAKGADGNYIVNTAKSKTGNYNLIKSDFKTFTVK